MIRETRVQRVNNSVCCDNIYRFPLNDDYSNKIFLDNLEECFQNNKKSLNKYIINRDLNYDLSHLKNFAYTEGD